MIYDKDIAELQDAVFYIYSSLLVMEKEFLNFRREGETIRTTSNDSRILGMIIELNQATDIIAKAFKRAEKIIRKVKIASHKETLSYAKNMMEVCVEGTVDEIVENAKKSKKKT